MTGFRTTFVANFAWLFGTASCFALSLASCAPDLADREYLAALRGEETGMTREQQIACIDRAIRIAPTRAHYYETRAIYWIDLRQFDRARADLDRDIALVDRPYAYFLRGLAACQMGDFSPALADFDTAIAGHPENTQFYRGRSLARAATGNVSGALEDAERLVSMAPQMAESYYARGVARAQLAQYRDAITDFEQAARIRPELVYVLEASATARHQVGDTAGAESDRLAVEQARATRGNCAVCLDPFRY